MGFLLPVSIVVLTFGMPVSNIKKLQFSNRITILISVVCISLFVFLLSFADEFWLYLLIHAFGFNMSIGFGYMAPIKNCVEHIPKMKGTYYIIKVCAVEFVFLAMVFPHFYLT